MKATIEFNLPDEREEHEAAVHGLDWQMILWDLLQAKSDFLTEAGRTYVWNEIEERGLVFAS